MYRNMVTSLLEHERIETTDAKAKEVRRIAERMITLGKRGGLHARRRALRVIRSREVATKVFDELADRYRERPGGYTRVLKLGIRKGDAAAVSIVELVDGTGGVTPVKEPAADKKKAAAAKAASKKAEKKKADAKKKSESKKKAAAAKAAAKKTASKKSSATKTASKKKTTKKATAAKSAAAKAASKKKAAKKKTKKKK
jgi:large subunit ribosomal protein L17